MDLLYDSDLSFHEPSLVLQRGGKFCEIGCIVHALDRSRPLSLEYYRYKTPMLIINSPKSKCQQTAKAILHFVSLLILHLEFVMKKTCPSEFYFIGFSFFRNYCIFTHLFDFVCQVDVHEPLKAQQTTAIVKPLVVLARCSPFYSPQPENATATFTSSDITITIVLLRQYGKQNQEDE